MNKSILDHCRTIYSDEYAESYSPIWTYRVKFIARALFYRKSFRYLADNIDTSLLELLCTRTHRFLEKPFRPYIIKNGPAFERSSLVVEHYNSVSDLI
ncbi:DUF535 family protein, partial [Vibrio sp. AND4]|uniref:DUF535 family protein n=1 Tax=Vibrio sp. AND4 TaxID=314289 RepID=UPI0003086822